MLVNISHNTTQILTYSTYYPKIGYYMQQIRITRTADLNGVLSFLKERYPLLSEAEIIKMALSNQYYQETEGGAKRQNPREHFTKEEWEKGQ